MIDYEKKFDTNNIHSVELNLLDGQVEIILRALELYGYNLEYMLNGSDATDGLKQEYTKSLKLYHITNIRQLFLLLLGIFFLFLSTLIKEDVIWKEVLLIGGWVPIWETIDIELFSDLEGRRKRIILKRLLESEIIEK